MNSARNMKPWLLSGPAFILFLVLLLIPLVMTFLLSFNSFSFYGGIEDVYNFGNYLEVLGDSYFYEIFLRTFLIALGDDCFLCAAWRSRSLHFASDATICTVDYAARRSWSSPDLGRGAYIGLGHPSW